MDRVERYETEKFSLFGSERQHLQGQGSQEKRNSNICNYTNMICISEGNDNTNAAENKALVVDCRSSGTV